MAKIPVQKYRVRSPNGEIVNLSFANARDLVKCAGYEWVKGEATVVAQAQDEATKKSFVAGNDPSKLDLDKVAREFAAANKTASIDEMARDELISYAEEKRIPVDKRWGSDKLRDAIKAAQAPPAPADDAKENGETGEGEGSSEKDADGDE